jgi:cutinase
MLRLFTASVTLLAVLAAGQECPENPGTDPSEPPFGSPIPPRPEDIPAGCSGFEILTARGTSEPGTFGYRVGDPLVGNVTESLPGSRGYPVQYPASFDFENGVEQGGTDVVDRIQSQSISCPNQTFSLVGYSQGAMVMRNGLQKLPTDLFDKVKSIVLFGDPEIDSALPDGLEDKLLDNCAPGDSVCDRSGTYCPYSHISYTYPEWMEPSATFIITAFTTTS